MIRFCWAEGGGYGQETVLSGADHHDTLQAEVLFNSEVLDTLRK
jgi:hypothetical protein